MVDIKATREKFSSPYNFIVYDPHRELVILVDNSYPTMVRVALDGEEHGRLSCSPLRTLQGTPFHHDIFYSPLCTLQGTYCHHGIFYSRSTDVYYVCSSIPKEAIHLVYTVQASSMEVVSSIILTMYSSTARLAVGTDVYKDTTNTDVIIVNETNQKKIHYLRMDGTCIYSYDVTTYFPETLARDYQVHPFGDRLLVLDSTGRLLMLWREDGKDKCKVLLKPSEKQERLRTASPCLVACDPKSGVIILCTRLGYSTDAKSKLQIFKTQS